MDDDDITGEDIDRLLAPGMSEEDFSHALKEIVERTPENEASPKSTGSHYKPSNVVLADLLNFLDRLESYVSLIPAKTAAKLRDEITTTVKAVIRAEAYWQVENQVAKPLVERLAVIEKKLDEVLNWKKKA